MKKILFALLVLSITACASSETSTQANTPNTPVEINTPLEITSPAFANEGKIPSEFTCDGVGKSPVLTWTESPAGTKSFALIVEDNYAPPASYTHWIIYNIPASTRDLKEAVPTDAQFSDGSLQGKNSGGTVGYQGPCPPSGTHRYIFTLYALDTTLSVSDGGNKISMDLAMKGHILTSAELVGTFR